MRAENLPLRVGQLTGADLRRGAPGGIRSYVLGLSRFLIGRGVSVDMFSNGPAEELAGGRIRPISPSHVPSAIGFQRALLRWSDPEGFSKIDVLHLHRPDDARPLMRRHDVPRLVLTLHGNPALAVRRRRGIVAGSAYRKIEARAMRSFDAIVAVDEESARSYADRYPQLADRIRVIPIAISDDAGRPSDDPIPRRSNALTFLFAGRLSVEKRVHEIISALNSPQLAGARLQIAGSGPEEQYLRKLSSAARVEFLGNVPQEELWALYQAADALVLASEYEGLPTVAVEALSVGCPVVGLPRCGLDRLVRGGGVIIADDISNLPQAMVRAAEIRRSGKSFSISSEHRWSRVGSQILSVYQELSQEAGA